MSTRRGLGGAVLRASFLALIALTSACASQPEHAPLERIAPGTRIRVVAHVAGVETPDARDGSESVGKTAAAGAGIGAGAGAVEGLKSSAQCGPLVLFCAPVFAAFGAGAGAVVGTIGGGVAGATRSLPEEKAERLEDIIATTLEEVDIPATLVNEFRTQSGRRWKITEGEAPVRVELGIERLFIDQFRKDELLLELTTSMVVHYGPGETDVTKKILLDYTTEQHHVDYWIDNDGSNLRTAISDGFKENIRKIIAVLAYQ